MHITKSSRAYHSAISFSDHYPRPLSMLAHFSTQNFKSLNQKAVSRKHLTHNHDVNLGGAFAPLPISDSDLETLNDGVKEPTNITE